MTNPVARRLLACVAGGATVPRLSVIGLSKNAGKTVTLNHLIRAAADDGLPLGLVSTGRDGEEQDAITELPKPRIWAPAGAWVATAQGALPACTAAVAPAAELPVATPFGPLVVGRVEAPGDVLLIGPGSARRIRQALDALEHHGARLCLVDGSFDRIAAASPEITGQVVLAVGAAYSASMSETVGQVRHVLDLFDLPTLELPKSDAPVSVIGPDGAITPVPVPSALSDPEKVVAAALAAGDSPTLALNGALGDRLLMALLQLRAAHVRLVVADPTHVLVDRNVWRRWRRQGGQAFVRRPIRVLAVTTNPHSPVGQDYGTQAFFSAVREVAAQRPVFDLEAGLYSPETPTGGGPA